MVSIPARKRPAGRIHPYIETSPAWGRREEGGAVGSISYRKLWHMLLDRDIKKTQLRDMAHISSSTLAQLSQGQPVTLRTIAAICDVLHCQPADILEYVPENWPKSHIQKTEKNLKNGIDAMDNP